MSDCVCSYGKCIVNGMHLCSRVGKLNDLGFPKEICCACFQRCYDPEYTPDKWCQQCIERIYGCLMFANPNTSLLLSSGQATDSSWFRDGTS